MALAFSFYAFTVPAETSMCKDAVDIDQTLLVAAFSALLWLMIRLTKRQEDPMLLAFS